MPTRWCGVGAPLVRVRSAWSVEGPQRSVHQNREEHRDAGRNQQNGRFRSKVKPGDPSHPWARAGVKVTQLCSLGAFVGILTLGACGVAGAQTRSGVSTTTEPPTTTTTVPTGTTIPPRSTCTARHSPLGRDHLHRRRLLGRRDQRCCQGLRRRRAAAWRPLPLCPHRGHRRSSGKHVGLLVAGRQRRGAPSRRRLLVR